jgi:formylglycine-generating enzyme required for sulfatase activity
MRRLCSWLVTLVLLTATTPAAAQGRDSAPPRKLPPPPAQTTPPASPAPTRPDSQGRDIDVKPKSSTSAPRQPSTTGGPTTGLSLPATYADSWAVIIGINDYQHPRVPKLGYAVNDAMAVERALLSQGFRRDRIFTMIDAKATKAEIERVLADDLRARVGPEDRVLMFFAGHGKTDKIRSGEEEGYLIPVDGDPGRLFSTAISMSSLRSISDRLPAKHILFVVDACYSGYAVFNRNISDDLLEEMVRKPAIQILTAGRQSDQAQERSGHGVFTEVLIRGLQGEAFSDKTWLSLEELGVWMKQRVFAESNKKQLPQFGNLSGEGQFVFTRPAAQAAAVSPPRVERRPPLTIEDEVKPGSLAVSSRVPGVEVWLGDQKIGETRAGHVLVARQLPPGVYKVTGRKPGHKDWEREVRVEADARAEVPIDIEPLRDEPSRGGSAKTIKAEDGVTMVLVQAGEFWMGSADGDDKERPRRRVTLGGFHIDVHEVTNGQFRAFVEGRGYERQDLWTSMGWRWRKKDPGPETVKDIKQPAFWVDPRWNDPRQPVVGVSWHEADVYCRLVGKRLPTEAEWEKAARGTEGAKYPWGEFWEPHRVNSDQSRADRTSAVGSYPSGASPYGVLDMAGNVAEWVADWYHRDYYKRSPDRNPTGPELGEEKVVRGGSWDSNAKDLRATARRNEKPDERTRKIGFRCVKESP